MIFYNLILVTYLIKKYYYQTFQSGVHVWSCCYQWWWCLIFAYKLVKCLRSKTRGFWFCDEFWMFHFGYFPFYLCILIDYSPHLKQEMALVAFSMSLGFLAVLFCELSSLKLYLQYCIFYKIIRSLWKTALFCDITNLHLMSWIQLYLTRNIKIYFVQHAVLGNQKILMCDA